jgi:hypothetical protein
MSHFESPESSVAAETDQQTVTDNNPEAQQEQISKVNQQKRWPLILGIILVIAGGGFGWR